MYYLHFDISPLQFVLFKRKKIPLSESSMDEGRRIGQRGHRGLGDADLQAAHATVVKKVTIIVSLYYNEIFPSDATQREE